MDSLLLDLRAAARSALRAPGSTAVVLLTLAIAIGANALAYTLVRGVLLRPLPYPQAERLVRIWETAPNAKGGPTDRNDLRSVAHPTLAEWRIPAFSALALYGPWSADLTGSGTPEQVAGATVSGDFFAVLGVQPALGRAFLPAELLPGGPRVVVLGDGFWRRRFAADPAVVGRTIRLSGEPFQVIGVMPPGFAYPRTAQLWATTAVDGEYAERGARHLSAIARLREGVSLETATGQLLARERELARRMPENYAGFGVRLFPLREWIVAEARPTLVVLFAAVAAVLLLACANLANLMLHRTLRRDREIALRTAMGASGARLVRLLLAETLGLALLGGALGVALAAGGLDLVRALAADQLPRLDEVRLDRGVLLFSAATALVAGLLVGLLPALHARASGLLATLSGVARTASSSLSRARLRAGLVVAQTAIAVCLLVAAGLLVRTLLHLGAVEPGVQVQGVLTFHVGLPPAREEDGPAAVAFFSRLQERLATVPGVAGVAFASRLPLSGEDHSTGVRFPGEPATAARERSVQDRAVTQGYFRTLGIPVRGREIEPRDLAGGLRVAVVNETFARRFFAGRDPLGEVFYTSGGGETAPIQIVGVAGDARQFGLDAPAEPEFAVPHAQDPWPWMSAVVRVGGASATSDSRLPAAASPRTAAGSSQDARALLPAIESAVWSLAPEMPLTEVRTLDEMVAAGLAARRWNALVLTAFAALALALAAVGTYSVMAFLVAERRREMGIRLALGADPRRLLALVVRQGVRLAVGGALLGSLLAALAARGLRGMLFGVPALDAPTFLAVVALALAAVALASLLPARRAAGVDPVRVLRE